MKILKKTITIAIILVLCITLKIYAGRIEAKLTANSTNVKVGETVTVTLSGYHGNGVEGFNGALKYDGTKLKLINEEQLATTNYTNASGIDELTKDFMLTVMYGGSGKGPVEANLAQLKFEILDGAKANDVLNIKLTKANLMDSNDNENELDDIEINLKVVEEQKKPEGNTNTNTPGENTNTNTPGGNTNTNTPGDYPYAGFENYMPIIIFVVAIIAIAVYVKTNKYRDIK